MTERLFATILIALTLMAKQKKWQKKNSTVNGYNYQMLQMLLPERWKVVKPATSLLICFSQNKNAMSFEQKLTKLRLWLIFSLIFLNMLELLLKYAIIDLK